MRILIFGDSIAVGLSDAKEGGWTSLLKRHLWQESGFKHTIYTRAVSGDTTTTLLLRIDTELQSMEPEVVIFAIGINDTIFYKDKSYTTDPETFKKNLQTLIEKARTQAKHIIFLGLTDIGDSRLKPSSEKVGETYYERDTIDKYDKIIQSMAIQNNIQYISMKALLWSSDLYDGLHPNTRGHFKIFEKVQNFLLKDGYL